MRLEHILLEKQYDDDIGGGGGSAPFKHIIIGIDGTWQAAFRDRFQSNVHRMNIALNFSDKTASHNPQIFIYSAGVGTANQSSKIFAGLSGEGLDELILNAYINLASNYVPGDRIYIFGFSRGAVAARALVSFIRQSGLLRANFLSFIDHAWRYFTRDEATVDYAQIRPHTFAVDIEFLGVWDTVPGPYRFEDLRKRYRFENLLLPRSVKCGAHVLSMDDTRKAFAPLLWEGRSDPSQLLEQVWLPGVHGDIGGGYGSAFISTISLLLMIEILANQCPVLSFDQNYIDKALLPIVENEDVVINDEWSTYPGRYLKYFLYKARSLLEKPDHCHFQHPLAELMTGVEIEMRSRSMRYAPHFCVQNQAGKLSDARYMRGSVHSGRLENALKGRFQSRP